MINLNRCRKAFDKTQHPLKIKDLIKVGIDGTCHKIIKDIYDKPTANIIFTGEKGQRCPLLSLLFISLDSPSHRNRQRKIKASKLERRVKLSLSGSDMMGYIKNKLKIPPKNY